MLDKCTLVKTETFEKAFKETAVLPACAYAADIMFSTIEIVAGVDKASEKGVPGKVIADVFAQNTSMPKEKIDKLWNKAAIVSFSAFRKQVIDDRSIARLFKNSFLGSTDGLQRKQTAKKIDMPKA